jgi:hypothetical protein
VFIDIHVHVMARPTGILRNGKPPFSTPDALLKRYDELGIDKAVILPSVSPECQYVSHDVDDALEIAEKYPDRFIPFCNIDPRMMTNSPDAPLSELLKFYKSKGCKGVGEITANLRFDNPLVENLFRHCEKAKMPVTFHISPSIGGNYGLYDEPGLPLLEGALRKFPELVFLGHSQAFWAEIGPLKNPDDRKGYPKGKVEKGGRVVELMRTYPNLHGDLSAMSGFNSISRDEKFGVKFLNEFEDRLHFGTDICAPDTPAWLIPHLLKLRDKKKISKKVFAKVASENTAELLGV